MRHTTIVLAFVLAIALFATPIWADSWTAIGPDGGNVYSIRFDHSRPDRVYAGTSSGVYRSTDGGLTWVFSGLLGLSIENITVASAPSDTLYVSSGPWFGPGFGVFRSSDSGSTWVSASTGLEVPGGSGSVYRVISHLAIDSNDADVVWAATHHEGNPSDLEGGLYRTTDGGRTWQHAAFALRDCLALAIDPNNPAHIWIVLKDAGVFKSTNRGETWMPAREGLLRSSSVQSRYLGITALEIAPSDSDVVYGLAQDEIVRTIDGGERWDVVAIRAQRSSFTSLVVDDRDAGTFWLTTWLHGVTRTADGGETWQGLLAGRGCTSSAIDQGPPPDRRLLLGSSYDGLFSADDGGTRWSRSQAGLQAHQISSIATDPAESNWPYAATRGPGFFVSSDGGSTWTLENAGFGPKCPSFNPDSPDCRVIDQFAIARESSTLFVAGECGVYRRKDRGESWENILGGGGVPSAGFRGLAVDPTDNLTLYTALGSAILSSRNGGDSWSACTDIADQRVLTLSVAATTAAAVFAGTYNGVFRSLDHCGTWTGVGLDGFRVFTLSSHPELADTIFAGTEDGLHVSSDGGTSWEFLGLEGLSITSLVVESKRSERLFAGTTTDGVFTTRNNGETWRRLVLGLDNPHVTALELREDGSVLYAGTAGNGVYELGIHPAGPRPPAGRIQP